MLLDRVKSLSVMRAPTAVKALMGNIVFDVVDGNIVFDVVNGDIVFDVVNGNIVFDVVNGDIELMAANEMTLKRSNSRNLLMGETIN